MADSAETQLIVLVALGLPITPTVTMQANR